MILIIIIVIVNGKKIILVLLRITILPVRPPAPSLRSRTQALHILWMSTSALGPKLKCSRHSVLVLCTTLWDEVAPPLPGTARILRQGSAMVVGVAGSGKQSLTRLAAFIGGFKCYQLQLRRGDSPADFREDFKVGFPSTSLHHRLSVFSTWRRSSCVCVCALVGLLVHRHRFLPGRVLGW